jgi:TolB protein
MPVTSITKTPIDTPTIKPESLLYNDITKTPTPTETTAAVMKIPTNIISGPIGKIVYTCEVLRDADIFDQICIINADGTGQRQLTDTEGSAYYPALSPDGNQVIFVSNMSGVHDIYEMDLNTGNIDKLTSGLGDPTSPRISPDGNLIAFANVKNKITSLYVMNRDGSYIHAIYNGGGLRPAWSPDGSQLSFYNESDGQIYIIDKDGNNPYAITSSKEFGAGTSWSSDGNYLAFYQGSSPDRQLYLMDTRGSNIKKVTSVGENLGPTFSPDGNWIGFSCYKPGARNSSEGEIYIIRADGTGLQQLTHNSLLDWQPYWGP